MKKGKMFIIIGPGAVGKSTVVDSITSSMDNIEESISMTTRTKRDNETEGVQYYFVTKEEFQRAIDNDEMLEYAEFVDNLYGTPKKSVYPKLEQGINIISIVEIQGAINMEKTMEEVISIFLMPPSIEELERRLRVREGSNENYIQKRLREAKKEMNFASYFDYIVVNDNLEKAVDRIKQIIKES